MVPVWYTVTEPRGGTVQSCQVCVAVALLGKALGFICAPQVPWW